MKEAAQRLRKAAANLEERVRFNQSSLSEAIEMLIGQVESNHIMQPPNFSTGQSQYVRRLDCTER